jgi:hypothetical protein
MSELVCPFCGYRSPNVCQEINHLRDAHRDVTVPVGKAVVVFRFRQVAKKRPGLYRVQCLCGLRFVSCQDTTPLFPEVSCDVFEFSDSFNAHLTKAGGLGLHLQKLRDEAMLDWIGKGDVGVVLGVNLDPVGMTYLGSVAQGNLRVVAARTR